MDGFAGRPNMGTCGTEKRSPPDDALEDFDGWPGSSNFRNSAMFSTCAWLCNGFVSAEIKIFDQPPSPFWLAAAPLSGAPLSGAGVWNESSDCAGFPNPPPCGLKT